jgi:hypothetical protein
MLDSTVGLVAYFYGPELIAVIRSRYSAANFLE